MITLDTCRRRTSLAIKTSEIGKAPEPVPLSGSTSKPASRPRSVQIGAYPLNLAMVAKATCDRIEILKPIGELLGH